MKQTKWFLALALIAASALTAPAQDFYSTNASGTTLASVAFASRPGAMSLINLDVTSDKAASVITWRAGAALTTAAVAATISASNVTTYASALAANDVVLVQNAAGTVLQRTIWGRTQATNQTVYLDNVIGTNLAVGDTFTRALTNRYTLVADVTATNSTALLTDSTNALAAGSLIYAAPGNVVIKSIVTNVQQVAGLALPVTATAADLAPGDLVWLQATNNALALGSSSGTNLHVATTNGFAAANTIRIMTATGRSLSRVIYSVALTNLALTVALGTAAVTNDVAYLLGNGTTNLLPAVAGSPSLTLGRTNSLITGSTLVCVPSSRDAFAVRVSGLATTGTVKTINLMDPVMRLLSAGTAFYKITNTYTATVVAPGTAQTITVSATNGLTAGTDIIISPATGGNFLNKYRLTQPVVVNTVTFTTTNGLAISAGDRIYSTTVSTTPCGAATVRLSGSSLRLAPANAPALLTVDGTSACAINDATVK
jgi:hypothetical protein